MTGTVAPPRRACVQKRHRRGHYIFNGGKVGKRVFIGVQRLETKKARSRRRSNAARRLQGAYVQNDSARDEP